MEIRVSVRQLVEFILREGSIDNRKSGGADTAMQEGSRIHRMLQRRMGSEYHAEIGLQCTWSTPEYDIIIEGRADGIIDYNWGSTMKSLIPWLKKMHFLMRLLLMRCTIEKHML